MLEPWGVLKRRKAELRREMKDAAFTFRHDPSKENEAAYQAICGEFARVAEDLKRAYPKGLKTRLQRGGGAPPSEFGP